LDAAYSFRNRTEQPNPTRTDPPLFLIYRLGLGAFDLSKIGTDATRCVDRLLFRRAKRAVGLLVRIILQFETRFSRSRLGFLSVLPAGHYWRTYCWYSCATDSSIMRCR